MSATPHIFGVRHLSPAAAWHLRQLLDRVRPLMCFFCDPKEDLVALVFCQHVPLDRHGLFTKFRTAVYQALE